MEIEVIHNEQICNVQQIKKNTIGIFQFIKQTRQTTTRVSSNHRYYDVVRNVDLTNTMRNGRRVRMCGTMREKVCARLVAGCVSVLGVLKDAKGSGAVSEACLPTHQRDGCERPRHTRQLIRHSGPTGMPLSLYHNSYK